MKAQQFLASLDDPRANTALATMLIEETKTKARARITNYDGQPYLGMLMRMPQGSATPQFIQIARELDYPAVVDQVLEVLASNERTRVIAMQAFVADLRPGKTPDVEYINRAGRNLETVGWMFASSDAHRSFNNIRLGNQSKSRLGGDGDKATGGISQFAVGPPSTSNTKSTWSSPLWSRFLAVERL